MADERMRLGWAISAGTASKPNTGTRRLATDSGDPLPTNASVEEDRIVEQVSNSHGVQAWSPRQAIIAHGGVRGRAFGHRGRMIAPCVYDQNPQHGIDKLVKTWTNG